MFHVEPEGDAAADDRPEVSRETKAEPLTSRSRDARIGGVPWRLGIPA
jgi:hypothetical protein